MCERGLDGWEDDDDPVREHLNFAPDCGWAINMAIEQAVENGTLGEDDPMSAELLEARKSTFSGRWPHEGKRGWTCKTQKVVKSATNREVADGRPDDRSGVVLLSYAGER